MLEIAAITVEKIQSFKHVEGKLLLCVGSAVMKLIFIALFYKLRFSPSVQSCLQRAAVT